MSLYGFSRDDEGTGRFQGRPVVFKPELGGRFQRGMYPRRSVVESVQDFANQDYPVAFWGSGGITGAAGQFATVFCLGGAPRTIIDAVVVSSNNTGEILIAVTSTSVAPVRQCLTVNQGHYLSLPFSAVQAAILETSETGVFATSVRLLRILGSTVPVVIPLGVRLAGPELSGGLVVRNLVAVQHTVAAQVLLAAFYGREFSE